MRVIAHSDSSQPIFERFRNRCLNPQRGHEATGSRGFLERAPTGAFRDAVVFFFFKLHQPSARRRQPSTRWGLSRTKWAPRGDCDTTLIPISLYAVLLCFCVGGYPILSIFPRRVREPCRGHSISDMVDDSKRQERIVNAMLHNKKDMSGSLSKLDRVLRRITPLAPLNCVAKCIAAPP